MKIVMYVLSQKEHWEKYRVRFMNPIVYLKPGKVTMIIPKNDACMFFLKNVESQISFARKSVFPENLLSVYIKVYMREK